MNRLALSFLFFAAAATAVSAQVIEEVVIKVNDAIVTKSEYDSRLKQTIEGIKREYKGPDLEQQLQEVPQRLIEQMAEELLLVEKAKQLYNVDSIVDFQVENFMKENKLATKDDLNKALEKEGLTMADFRRQVTMIFIPEFMKSREVRNKISVTTDEIKDYFNAHKDQFGQKPQVDLQEILILKDDHTAAQAKALYEQIQRELAQGKDFGALAKIYSQAFSRDKDGNAGTFFPGDLSPDLSHPVFALKAGQVTPLLETKAGWYIFKIVSRREAKPPTLDESREGIIEALKEQKFKQAYQDYIKELKAENFVWINPKYV